MTVVIATQTSLQDSPVTIEWASKSFDLDSAYIQELLSQNAEMKIEGSREMYTELIRLPRADRASRFERRHESGSAC